jgi:hypothetical protein
VANAEEARGRPLGLLPAGPENPDGYELPFHLDAFSTSAAAILDLSRSWVAQRAGRSADHSNREGQQGHDGHNGHEPGKA